MNKKNKDKIRVPYGFSLHDRREERAVARVIREHRTAVGPETAEFEQAVANIFGKRYGVMVNSGSSANLLALELLDLPEGSEVITPVLTFNTTLAPILQKKLKPVFVDAEPRTYLININDIEAKITKRTKALMVPLLLGNVPDMRRLRNIAKRHGLYLVEDSCDTLGAKFLGKPTGTYSDISTTSFYGSHVINAGGGGGMISVNRPEWKRRLLMLRGWGRTSSLFADSEDISKRFRERLADVPYDGKFIFAERGYNFLPLEMSAAFGRVQLKKLAGFSRTRGRNFNWLMRFFSGYQRFFELPLQTPGSRTNWLAFPITLKRGAPFSRFELVTFLERQNIQTRPIFSGNILRQPAYKALVRMAGNPGHYPVADMIMKRSLLIGCHQGLTPRHLRHLADSFGRFLARYE